MDRGLAIAAGIAVGAAAGVAAALGRNRARDREIEELRRERAILVSQVLEAEERERAKVAQALHDDALQSLLAAHQDLIEAAPGRAQVTRAHEIMGGAIDRVRDAVSALHPVILEKAGLEAALEALCRQAEGQAGIEASLEVAPDATGAHDGLVFSVARELITNVVRHAGARRLSVSVARRDGSLELEVADDGAGIPAGRREEAVRDGHVGLASVDQRLDAIGGRLEVESSRGEGTRARARIPVS
jgi:two-component system, NarL family, sensor kinase